MLLHVLPRSRNRRTIPQRQRHHGAESARSLCRARPHPECWTPGNRKEPWRTDRKHHRTTNHSFGHPRQRPPKRASGARGSAHPGDTNRGATRRRSDRHTAASTHTGALARPDHPCRPTLLRRGKPPLHAASPFNGRRDCLRYAQRRQRSMNARPASKMRLSASNAMPENVNDLRAVLCAGTFPRCERTRLPRMFPQEQTHPQTPHAAAPGANVHGHGAAGAPAPGAGGSQPVFPPQFHAAGVPDPQAGHGAPPSGAAPSFPGDGAPGVGAEASGAPRATPDEAQVPHADWTPAQWLDYILRRSNALESAIDGIRRELQVSDARADAATATARTLVHELGNRVVNQSTAKPSTPETFHGRTSEDVSQWIFSMEQYFLAVKVQEDRQKVNYATSLLRGSAALWWRQLVEDSGRPDHWNVFSNALRYQFVTTNTSIETRYHLSTLHQKSGHGVTEYARQCVSLCLRLRDMTETDKIFYFVRGLRKPEVRRDVLSRNPDTLADAIRLAEISDSSLYPGSSYRIGNYSHRRPVYPASRYNRSDSRRGSPMDLDNVNVGRSVLRPERYPNRGVSGDFGRTFRGRGCKGSARFNQRKSATPSAPKDKSKTTCFRCGKTGHYSFNCRSKRRQQFHHVEVQSDTEEFCNFAGIIPTSDSQSRVPKDTGSAREDTGDFSTENQEESEEEEVLKTDQGDPSQTQEREAGGTRMSEKLGTSLN